MIHLYYTCVFLFIATWTHHVLFTVQGIGWEICNDEKYTIKGRSVKEMNRLWGSGCETDKFNLVLASQSYNINNEQTHRTNKA